MRERSVAFLVVACLFSGCGAEPRREPLAFEIAKPTPVASPRELPAEPSATPLSPAPPEKAEPPKAKVRVWLWFTMERNCAPCERLKRRLHPECVASGLVVGEYGTGGVAHVWILDSTKHKKECKAWDVGLFPTLILVEDGKEVLRCNGTGLTGKSMLESLTTSYLLPWPYRYEHWPRYEWDDRPEGRIPRYKGVDAWTNC